MQVRKTALLPGTPDHEISFLHRYVVHRIAGPWYLRPHRVDPPEGAALIDRIRPFSLIILCSYAIFILCPGSAAAASPPVTPVPPAADGSSSMNMRSAHKWLGYSAIALGTVAAFSSSSEDLHCATAWGAAVLGAAAVTTGIIKYRRTVDLSNGISRLDGHAILGGLAAAGFITACVLAGTGGEDDDEWEDDDDSNKLHAGIGGVALATMAVSVVIIKVKW